MVLYGRDELSLIMVPTAKKRSDPASSFDGPRSGRLPFSGLNNTPEKKVKALFDYFGLRRFRVPPLALRSVRYADCHAHRSGA